MAPKPKPEATKKTSKSKQPPKRGMGVAQLERLRMESVPNPLSSAPLHYVAANYGGGGPVNSSGSGLFDFDRAGFVVQRFSGNGLFVDPNPYRIGALDQRVQVGSVYDTSKELSSMPKMQSLPSDRCDTCSKKKRFNGENIGVRGGKDKCSELMLPISSGTSCFGLNAGTIPTFAGNHTLGFGVGSSRTGYVDNQGVEVVAIHRKGNTSARGGESVVMEYDFFPAGNKQEQRRRGSYSKDIEILPTEASVAVLGGGGSGSSSSDPLDLTLKL